MLKKFTRADLILMCAMVILLALRIWVGQTVNVLMEVPSPHDHMLMIQYADLYQHFVDPNTPFNMTLVKDMGFPIFLNVVKFSGLSYVDLLSLIWFVAAILMVALFVILTCSKDRKIWFLVYAYVLFTPIAFDYTGRQLYRNSFLSPMYFVVLEMMAVLFICYFKPIQVRLKPLAIFNLIFGVVFVWTFYTKEDGLWLLMCLATVLILCLSKMIFCDILTFETKLSRVAILLIPIVIFSTVTMIYKAVNYKFFGVYIINDRVEGELGNFLKLVYKVKSDNRTGMIWAPADAIDKVFNASETLKQNTKLYDEIIHTQWFGGDITKNPICGDFLGWVTLTAIEQSGTCHNLVEEEEYFRKVNSELQTAFDNGALQRDSKIQLVSTMGGRSIKEILGLSILIGRAYLAHIITKGYSTHFVDRMFFYVVNVAENREMIMQTSKVVNMDLINGKIDVKKARRTAKVIFSIYSIINTFMFIAGIVTMIKWSRDFVKRRKNFLPEYKLPLLILISCIALSFMYALAIAWFSEFTDISNMILYSSAMVPMLSIFEIVGAYYFVRQYRQRINYARQ